MSRRWHWLTRDEKRQALHLARANPDRSWSDIARALGRPRWAVVRYLRRHCPPRHRGRWPTPMPTLADPVTLACPACCEPVPPLPDGVRYRCPCGRLIVVGTTNEGAA